MSVPDTHTAPVDWPGQFSGEALDRSLPSLRVIISQFQGVPGIIGLHGGLPAASAFPITSMSFTLRDGTTATIDDPVKVRTQLWAAQSWFAHQAGTCVSDLSMSQIRPILYNQKKV